jgi:hypothetical protein
MEISANTRIWSEARQWRREQPEESVTNKLAEDKPELEDEIEPQCRFEEIIGKSPALMRTLTTYSIGTKLWLEEWSR